MSEEKKIFKGGRMDVSSRIIHIGLIVFVLSAYLTGDGADAYKKADFFDYTVHKWLGMGVCAFISVRILYGLLGPEGARFSSWVPYTKERLVLARNGFLSIFAYRRPERQAHQGIAGFVKSAGMAIFVWMSLTGTFMFFFLQPGGRARGLVHFVKEIHEVGETLVPLYLVVHIGAVLVHALYGKDIWRRVFFIKKPSIN